MSELTGSLADAMTLQNHDLPSSDVRNTQFQEGVANSLLDPEGARPLSSFNIDSTAEERIAEEWPNSEQVDFLEEASDGEAENPEADLEIDEFVKLSAQEAAELQTHEEESSAELTEQNIQEGVEQLNVYVEANGLNDPGLARSSADEFYAAFGAEGFGSVNYEAWGMMDAKSSLSVRQIYDAVGGDVDQVPPVPPVSAAMFSQDFIRANGADPRLMQVKYPDLLANTVFQAKWNAYDSVRRGQSDVQQINNPNVSIQAVENVMRAVGASEDLIASVPREQKLHVADVWMRNELKRQSAYDEFFHQAQAAQRRSVRGSNRSASRRSSSRFKSNSDLFDLEAEQEYRLREGRL
jgi:hypothetical protein